MPHILQAFFLFASRRINGERPVLLSGRHFAGQRVECIRVKNEVRILLALDVNLLIKYRTLLQGKAKLIEIEDEFCFFLFAAKIAKNSHCSKKCLKI